MIFDIWRLVVKAMPMVGIVGVVMYILGAVGDPKLIKDKKMWKKWGIILIGVTLALIVIQMIVTYFLLLNS